MKADPAARTSIAGIGRADRPSGTDVRILAEASTSPTSPGRLLKIVLIAGLSAASFGSQSLVDWTAAKRDSPAMMKIHSAMVAWDQMMERMGLAVPADILRKAVQALKAISFDED